MKSTKNYENLIGKRLIALTDGCSVIKNEIYYIDREFTETKGYYFLAKIIGGSCEAIFCPSDLGTIFKFYDKEEIINNYSIY